MYELLSPYRTLASISVIIVSSVRKKCQMICLFRHTLGIPSFTDWSLWLRSNPEVATKKYYPRLPCREEAFQDFGAPPIIKTLRKLSNFEFSS